MARLAYVAPDGDVTDRIRQRRGGKLTALDGVLLHSPPFADGWNGMLGAVRGASTLPADFSGHSQGSEIRVSHSGDFVFTSNRGDLDSIAIGR